MIKLLLCWILGLVTLSVILGSIVLAHVLYEAFHEDYFLFIFGIVFMVAPLATGSLVYLVHGVYEKYRTEEE